MNNLAGVPSHLATLERLRARLDRWMVETKDRGPEAEAMYDSNMKAVAGEGGGKAKATGDNVNERNIAQMKVWAREGK